MSGCVCCEHYAEACSPEQQAEGCFNRTCGSCLYEDGRGECGDCRLYAHDKLAPGEDCSCSCHDSERGSERALDELARGDA